MLSSFYKEALQTQQNDSHKNTAIDERLNISTAESMQARLGQGVQYLQADVRTLLSELESVGTTLSITRNQHAIHEVIGRYENQRIIPNGHSGVILNPGALDLRLFFNQFGHVFSLEEPGSTGPKYSIHFYDTQGHGVHEVHCINETDKTAWLAVIKKYATETPGAPHISAEKPNQTSPQKTFEPSNELIQEIEMQWRAMDDVHQFFKLLNQYGVKRTQLFHAVKNQDLARRVKNTALISLLEESSQEQNNIMIFVPNRACTQIFTGAIEYVMLTPQHPWMTASNSTFSLHLNINAITESWITRKNTKDGFVTSLEVFDANGDQIVQLFGQRAEGQHEQKQWRRQTFSLLSY
ncbi:hemin-degrading factor [Candidatus Williamhamiltonella defendens]|uniref:Hemin transport n=1 Tax=Candidatus Hamiltonella defensa (Bemisia tabaci) TaxID=672795 RepID=A0A249DWC4_9ENTR|nr:hemin-degrading factor [Candidatus Hamiltonella defensa]ASX25853.1 hemin transport [Candidatus Hamiltonella defensa (Bemisia tabaci)]CED78641.1 Hemin transport protein HmuS [Candidatus Hamiltonella defensa (Bemisia tabaci)]